MTACYIAVRKCSSTPLTDVSAHADKAQDSDPRPHCRPCWSGCADTAVRDRRIALAGTWLSVRSDKHCGSVRWATCCQFGDDVSCRHHRPRPDRVQPLGLPLGSSFVEP